MKIAVCLKRVPDSEARIKIGADAKSIDESGVKFVLNPYEEYAVEEALKLKEAVGSGEVVAISVGSEVSQETIRTALAMGADRGVLLKSDAVPLDPLPVAQALAAELKDGEYDLIVFGKVATDDYSHGVGVMVAELLGLPCVSAIVALEIADGKGVPAYIVFGDKTLKEMAAKRPQSKEEMLQVGGIGEVKFERYGEQFLVLLQSL